MKTPRQFTSHTPQLARRRSLLGRSGGGALAALVLGQVAILALFFWKLTDHDSSNIVLAMLWVAAGVILVALISYWRRTRARWAEDNPLPPTKD